MKLKLFSAVSLLAAVFLSSCAGDDNKEYVDKSIIPTAEEKAAAQKAAPANNTMPVNVQPQPLPGAAPVMVTNPQQIMAGQQSNVVMTPVQTQVQPTAPGMNPPHGQPGHRCDIAVGAPLNSKPATPAATTANAQPQVTMTEVPTKVKTLPGMNPPHGEPGHRCDIAVGAPLNSKPAATTVTTATTPASIAPPPLLTAPKTDSAKN
ncbi:MAG: hypothetical protein ACKOU7_07155 [Ferruginibacter sp.]